MCIHFESAQVSHASEVQEVQVILLKHIKVDSVIIIIHGCTHSKAEMKCPVCRALQVDPCTLQCGHTICQLCLARMYKNFDKFCPMCKEPWSMFPAISYDYRYNDKSSLWLLLQRHCIIYFDFRANIESSYGQQVSHLRMQYTQEDKGVIEEFLKAKRSYSPKSETRVGREGLFGNSKYSLILLHPHP